MRSNNALEADRGAWWAASGRGIGIVAGRSTRSLERTVKVIAGIAGVGTALITLLLAVHVFVDGRVFVPSMRIWGRGYVVGVAAYSMAVAWLCLGAGAVFASCMYIDRRKYFEYQRGRDISLIAFGALLIFSVVGLIVQRANGAL